MNGLLFYLVRMLILILAASSLAAGTLAQTIQPSPPNEEQPCIENSATGRPTLKRRQPAPDNSAANRNSTDQNLPEKAKCKQDGETDLLKDQKPIRMEFEGLHAFSESDVLKAFGERGAALPEGRMPNSEEIDKAVGALKELFQDRGYFQTTVDVSTNDQSKSITFVVNEGARLSVTEIRFEGNKVFPPSELAAKIGVCLTHYEEALHKGYEHEIFEYCRRGVTNFVRSQGYLQAKLDEPRRSVTGQGLVLTIPVEEGVLYRLGEIKIEGADAFSSDEIRSRLGLQQGEVANGEKIGKFLYEDLKRSYGEKGFIQYTAELNPTFKNNPWNASEGIVDVEVTIDEGERFRLGSINFIGDNLPEKELRDLFLIREGDIYNQRLFEESINRLNDSGLLDLLDPYKDADFRTNEEERTIKIVIKVQKRSN